MNKSAIIERLRAHPIVKDADPVGVAASFGHDVKVKDVDAKNQFIEITVNTADVDLEDEVVLPSGIDPKAYFLKNKGRWFVDHMYDFNQHVGVTRHFNPYPSATDHRSWRAVVHMINTEGNPLARDIMTVAKEAGIGASVGFMVNDMGPPDEEEAKRYSKGGRTVRNIVRKSTLLEVSFTAMPCNVSCQGGAIVDDSKAAMLEDMVSKSVIRAKSAYALGLPKGGEKRRPTKTVSVTKGGAVVVRHV